LKQILVINVSPRGRNSASRGVADSLIAPLTDLRRCSRVVAHLRRACRQHHPSRFTIQHAVSCSTALAHTERELVEAAVVDHLLPNPAKSQSTNLF
jgi:FMN-dependent NADH-azoreductase